MKKSYLIVGVILILIIAGLGIYFLKSPVKTSDTNVNVQSSAKTSPVGLWSVEKAYSYDDANNQFVETPIDFSVYGGNIYMEYTKDGKWCSQWDIGTTNCQNYDTYIITNDIITQNQEGLTGPEFHYKWKVDNGKLELTAEMFDDTTNQWTPFLKYSLKPTSK